MFDIRDSIAFYRLMIENYDDFVENSGSSRHAINCAISTFHMAEWIWGDWLGSDRQIWSKMGGIRDRDGFLGWLDSKSQWFSVVRGIANGSKHFASKLQNTRSSGTYVEDDYVEPDYQEQYLEIEFDGKWVEAIIVIEAMAMFWEKFFATYRPKRSCLSPVIHSLVRPNSIRPPFGRAD